MQILNSLTYTNLYSNDSITEEQRNITIVTTDADFYNQSLTIFIDVFKRNDGPIINLGGEDDTEFSIVFVENEESVAIGLTHLISITDEEEDSVSNITIELVSTNGPLDEKDSIFLRTPMPISILDIPSLYISTTMISISMVDNGDQYEQILRAVRYTNRELEPTLYNVEGAKLQREIVIRITDNSTDPAPTISEHRVNVIIQPINDNAPRIIINPDPRCVTEDCCSNIEDRPISRRSTDALRRVHKRRRRSMVPSDNRAVSDVRKL